ncbi:tetratricopeptide repeat protein [bacterium]|nr:tetratricopeptide repeat protein [bacterium]
MVKKLGLGVLVLMFCCYSSLLAKTTAKKQEIDPKKPRLVMVQVPSWKTTFFGLPQELPLLIKPGEKFTGKSKHYDFTEGISAMEVFIALRPKEQQSQAYRLFIKKWPLYQNFFKAVEQEKYAEAAQWLDTIIGIDPKEPAVHFYWGSLNTQTKKYAAAEKSYQACIEAYPGYGPAYINLARLVKSRGDDTQARVLLKKALEQLQDGDQDDARRIAQKMLGSLSGK